MRILIVCLVATLLAVFPKSSLAAPSRDYTKVKAVARLLAPHESEIEEYAFWINNYSKKYNLDPYLILAIIKVESDFNQRAISSTGDYSLAQINYKVWKKELARKGVKLNFYKLKTNYAYALETMGYILKTLHDTYGKKDPKWYARYHSNTSKHKLAYYKRVNTQLTKIYTLQNLKPKTNKKLKNLSLIAENK